LEDWKIGRLEDWRIGRLEDWKIGGLGGCPEEIKSEVQIVLSG
jgi:hypothetical protein